jgi:hypothetical protein
MVVPRVQGTGGLFRGGLVAFAGGEGADGEATTVVEYYDPVLDAFFAVSGDLSVNRLGPVGLSLPNGDFMVMGGQIPIGPSNTMVTAAVDFVR